MFFVQIKIFAYNYSLEFDNETKQQKTSPVKTNRTKRKLNHFVIYVQQHMLADLCKYRGNWRFKND